MLVIECTYYKVNKVAAAEVQYQVLRAQRHSVLFNLHLSSLPDQFNQMCPSGKGYISSEDVTYGELTADTYTGRSPPACRKQCRNAEAAGGR